MSIVVTGGAGFIGSCVVGALNEIGIEDIIIVDNIAQSDKWLNIRNKRYIEYIHKSEFLQRLGALKGITSIIHLGACSSTTERDFDYLWKNNVEYSKSLWKYAVTNRIRFIYASSASTYGDGTQGFDDEADIRKLYPLNPYGYSKQVFDLWTCNEKLHPRQAVGLKFFNVYGPNEYFKNSMASMVYHGYNQVKETGNIKLFKSYNHKFNDGEQLRDFIYVKDICKVIIYLLRHEEVNGIFNVGTGNAASFIELAEAVFEALDMKPNISFVDMPEQLRGRYQYFTEAKMNKLRLVGYDEKFYSIREGVIDYVCNYLTKSDPVY